MLQVAPALGIELLQRLIVEAEELLGRASLEPSDIQAWNNFARTQMARALGSESESIGSVMNVSGGLGFWMGQNEHERQQELHGQMENKIKLLGSCIKTLESEFEIATRTGSQAPQAVTATRSTLEILERLADRFHAVARQLRSRQRSRQPFTITDEYDVQDLLHALLRVEFDDVRAEENTPSYAGAGARMDFLLRKEETVVEAKCTRDGLDDKEIGKQLLVDIAKYRQHPHCKTLVCFVYDPDGRINNPDGLEHDLSHDFDGLPVRLFVRPV